MPIYEYLCSQCGKNFEMLQNISAGPMKKCIYCGGRVKKLVSSSSFTFKGSGFYINDYKNPAPAAEPVKETKSVVKSDTKHVAKKKDVQTS